MKRQHPFVPGVIDYQVKPASLWTSLAIAVGLIAVVLVVGFAAGYIPRWLS